MSAQLTEKTVTIEFIPARLLMVDHTVQRGLDYRRAERIASNFSPEALGMLTISRRADGTLHIVDGQHRHAVVTLLGHDDWQLHCQVHTGLTRQEEARMFRLLNHAKPPSVIERFLVRVQEEEPIATAINGVLHEHGWRVSSAKVDGSFSAVSSIEQPYVKAEKARNAGVELTQWVIGVPSKAWGMDSNGVRGEVITGLGHLYLRHGAALDTAKLIQELGAFNGGPRGMVARARSLSDYRGGTVGDAMAEHMVNLLNKGRRTKRLPDWRDADV